MTSEQFQKYQEQTFDSFCKTVIRNESIDAFREIAAKAKHEVQLSALSDSVLSSLYTEDTYVPYQKVFSVRGHQISVCDKALAEALQFLQPRQRQIVLLYYFLEYNDTEIGAILGISNHTVRLRRNLALRNLHYLLEASPYA